MHRPIGLIVVAIAVATVVPATAQTGKERIVNVYNWSDYIAPTVIEEFTRETGIKVRYDTLIRTTCSRPSSLPANPVTTWWRPPPISWSARSKPASSSDWTKASCPI